MKKQLMKLLDLLEEAHKIIAESIEKIIEPQPRHTLKNVRILR